MVSDHNSTSLSLLIEGKSHLVTALVPLRPIGVLTWSPFAFIGYIW